MFSCHINNMHIKGFCDVKKLGSLVFILYIYKMLLWRRLIAFIGFSIGSITLQVMNHQSNPLALFFKGKKNRGAERMGKFFKITKLVSGLG